MEVVEVEKLGCVVGVLWVVCSCLVLCWRIPTDGGSCLFVCFYRHYFLVFLPRLHLISSPLVLSCLALSSSTPVFCILYFTRKSFCLKLMSSTQLSPYYILASYPIFRRSGYLHVYSRSECKVRTVMLITLSKQTAKCTYTYSFSNPL